MSIQIPPVNSKPVAAIGLLAISSGCADLVQLVRTPSFDAAIWTSAATHHDAAGSVEQLAAALLPIVFGGVMAAFGRAPHIGGWFKGWGLYPDGRPESSPAQ